jgi:hypothetical protein
MNAADLTGRELIYAYYQSGDVDEDVWFVVYTPVGMDTMQAHKLVDQAWSTAWERSGANLDLDEPDVDFNESECFTSLLKEQGFLIPDINVHELGDEN